ncbi:MAG: YkgJ family cysteine cluster protein [Nitrospiraceae bacterium]|nr:MAG: YkgJ family cysteine cluster protein [Nitrospiraceae bacterium]
MAISKTKRSGPSGANRPAFPSDEKMHPWLRLLLDAYHIVDRGITRALDDERKKGRTLACKKGCSHCCATHKDIPVYPLELLGITWYVTEKFIGPLRETLRQSLEQFTGREACPFLMGGSCAVHTVRPMACRQFNVFGNACDEGEDPYYTRREDVMEPVKKYIDQAFFIMLPFYGVEKESERIKVVETGAFHKMVKELHACNWKSLAVKMKDFEARDSGPVA